METYGRGTAGHKSASGRRSPHNEAGTRIEPLVSEPSANGTSAPPTALPEPPDEPPLMRLMSCGLREGPS